MIYRTVLPSEFLRAYIKEYLIVHFVFNENEVAPIKPYPAIPEQGITFYVKGYVDCENESKIVERRPKQVIFGQPVSRQNLLVSKEFCMFNIRFQPGALYKLLKIPMDQFVQKNIDAQLIFGNEVTQLNDNLANAVGYADMISLVETFLVCKINTTKNNHHPSDLIPELIMQDPSPFNLAKLASLSCLSISQFERKFIREVGVSPKFYARVCRFHKAIEKKVQRPQLDWLSIAVQNGYCDYQHLAKDFKTFSGCTPNTLIDEMANSPEELLDLIPTKIK